MKIGLFSDPHYCHIEIPSPRRFTLSYKKITEAMEYFKAEGAELVLCLGDLVDDCRNYEDNVKSIKKIVGLIRSYGIPFYSLMGNHDYQNFTREEFDLLTGGAYPPARMDVGKSTLLFLDCNYGDDGRVYEPQKVDWTDTRLPEESLDSLENALADPTVKHAYVFSHQSIENEVEEHHIVHNAADIRAVLSASGKVRAMIQGHYHPGHDTVIDGVHYHTLPAMCEGETNYYEIMIVE
jgi:DNA repair exonuclease SbcCD nuclease subunit